jgi:hypothetical protein
MRPRLTAITAAVLLLVLIGVAPAVGQDASPPAEATTPPVVATGEGTPYVDAEGVNHGTITVRAIYDPFTEFDPNSPPADGQRYVMLDVVFDAAADEPFWADPYAIALQDTDGYLRRPTGLPRVQPVKLPDFQSQTLGPGDRLSGALGYVVPAASTTAAVQYLPENERIIPVESITTADARPVGTEIDVKDGAGVVRGTVTVRALQDPYTAFEPTRPPAEGTRYVLATVVFQAAIDQQLGFDPWQIMLQDTDGYLVRPTGVPRPATDVVPDLQGQVLAPDDRSSGYVGYDIAADRQIAAIVWSPEGGRLMTIADLGD